MKLSLRGGWLSQEMSSKKYLLTGASGFLGYHLVRQLLQDGAEVFIFDLNPPGSSRESFASLIY